MRDILDKLLLTESTGLAHRKPGDVFKSKEGDEIYFQSIRFYPEEGGKFTTEQLGQWVEQVTAELGNITWVNKPSARSGGFGVATFETPGGELLHFGRYFQDVKSYVINNFWGNNELPGYSFASKTSSKAKSGLTPQDILTQLDELSAGDIVAQISERLGGDHPFTLLANKIEAGLPLPIAIPKPAAASFSGFRDYFCELLHPIALQRGIVEGNAAEAEEIFLGDSGFAGCSISFGTSKTEGLSDSIMINTEGQRVKVSSKGGSGAQASVKNLVDAVDELTLAGNTKLKNKHKDIISMIRAIQSAGYKGAPVMLALQLGIINQSEANQVDDLATLENKNVVNYTTALNSNYLSTRLKRMYAERSVKNPSSASAYFHLLAAIAHRVAEHINKKTGFSAAAAEILNNGALVQVYTNAIEREHEWVLKSFKATYPGSATAGVLFSASKSYYSTGIKGNFTFKILKAGEKYVPEPDEELEAAAPTEISAATVDVATSKSSVKASDTKKAATADASSLGRARR